MARKSAPDGGKLPPKKSRNSATPAKNARANADNTKRGSSAAEERGAHNPDVAGSTPAPATKTPAGKRAGRAAGLPSRAEKGSIPSARSTTIATQPGQPQAPAAANPTATVRKLLRAPTGDPEKPLTPDIEAFIAEYLTNGLNATAAYRAFKPHVTPGVASTEAWRLLRKPAIRDRIDAIRMGLTKRVEMSRDQAIDHLQAIINADPSDLMQMRRTSCPGCYKGEKVGAWTDPDPECEVCDGEGLERPWFADTRKLHPAVRALFAGVKVTQQGIQVLMESKDAARDKLFKILGHYEADNRQKNAGLADVVREFLAGAHNKRMPIVKKQASAPGASASPDSLVRG